MTEEPTGPLPDEQPYEAPALPEPSYGGEYDQDPAAELHPVEVDRSDDPTLEGSDDGAESDEP
jgi:hypothetical protein